jgi:hypothetical protein
MPNCAITLQPDIRSPASFMPRENTVNRKFGRAESRATGNGWLSGEVSRSGSASLGISGENHGGSYSTVRFSDSVI